MPRGAHLSATTPAVPRRPETTVRGAVACRRLLRAVPAGVLLMTGCGGGPVEVTAPSPTGRAVSVCEGLLADAPARVAGLERRDVEPAGAAVAWGDPAIVLRCGVGGPEDYDPANGCTTVDEVDWYIPVHQLEANGLQDLTMTTLERDVTVEVRMPGDHWPPATTLADLSGLVAEHTRALGRCR